MKTHKPKTAKELLRYAKRFSYVLENPNMASQLQLLSKDVRRIAMASLSNLSKYCGNYEQWKQTIRNHGLKWENTSGIEAFLSILNSNINEIEAWLYQVVKALPKDYATVLVFDALTGLRPSEACMSCRLISEVSDKNMLEQYFDRELMMLQHFKFPNLFLRNSKNAYISFISPKLLEVVQQIKPKIMYGALDTRIGRLGFKVQTKQLRKLHGTILRNRGIPQELIDLTHGRISQNVFTRFYYKPFLQHVRDITLKALEPLQQQLLTMFS